MTEDFDQSKVTAEIDTLIFDILSDPEGEFADAPHEPAAAAPSAPEPVLEAILQLPGVGPVHVTPMHISACTSQTMLRGILGAMTMRVPGMSVDEARIRTQLMQLITVRLLELLG